MPPAGRGCAIGARSRAASHGAHLPRMSSGSWPRARPAPTGRPAWGDPRDPGIDGGQGARPRHGLSRRPRAPRPQILRYERARPGELLHVNTKRLGRFHAVGKRILADGVHRSPRHGWHHLHVAIDDHTRIAYCEVLAGQGADAACAFLQRAVSWFASRARHRHRARPVRQRPRLSLPRLARSVRRARRQAQAHPALHPAHQRQGGGLHRHGPARVGLRYAYPTSAQRTRALPARVHWYNRRRPHSSLGNRPPIRRVAQVCGRRT